MHLITSKVTQRSSRVPTRVSVHTLAHPGVIMLAHCTAYGRVWTLRYYARLRGSCGWAGRTGARWRCADIARGRNRQVVGGQAGCRTPLRGDGWAKPARAESVGVEPTRVTSTRFRDGCRRHLSARLSKSSTNAVRRLPQQLWPMRGLLTPRAEGRGFEPLTVLPVTG